MAVVALVVFLIFGFRLLAHAQRDAFLIAKAQTRVQLISHGATPYRWELRSREDLIAGRVFGVKKIAFDADGLRLQAGTDAFEIGLPLNNDVIDLQRFDRLRLRVLTQQPLVRCELVVRQTLAEAELTAVLPVAALGVSEEIALAALTWTASPGASAPAPARAASLRLRVLAPAGSVFHLDTLEVLPDPKFGEPGLLARSLAGATHATPALAGDTPIATSQAALPLVDYPSSISNEALMAYFDRLRGREPSALLVPQGGLDALQANSPPAPKASSNSSWASWLSVAALAAGLLFIRYFPPRRPRLRATLELIGVLAPALAIVIGGLLGNDLDAAVGTALLCVAVFAFSLPRTPWRWTGDWGTWLLPGVVIAIAILLASVWGDHLKLPGSLILLRYVAWAALQQYLVCIVITDRCRMLGLADRWTVVLVAAMFALLHTPNETLMLATFAGGLIWTTAWLRDRCFVPIVVSHALSAMIVFSTLPPDVLRSAEVSTRFFLS